VHVDGYQHRFEVRRGTPAAHDHRDERRLDDLIVCFAPTIANRTWYDASPAPLSRVTAIALNSLCFRSTPSSAWTAAVNLRLAGIVTPSEDVGDVFIRKRWSPVSGASR
jgi:hypothetical protein